MSARICTLHRLARTPSCPNTALPRLRFRPPQQRLLRQFLPNRPLCRLLMLSCTRCVPSWKQPACQTCHLCHQARCCVTVPARQRLAQCRARANHTRPLWHPLCCHPSCPHLLRRACIGQAPTKVTSLLTVRVCIHLAFCSMAWCRHHLAMDHHHITQP